MARPSTTWPSCTRRKASTPTPRGCYKRALAIREKALGASHPDVAQTLNNLAVVYQEQGKYADAEGLYKRALAIYEKALGEDHPDVAQTLNNLADVYQEQGKYADAEGLHQRALAIKEKALGADHPGVAVTLNNLANVYQEQGKYADAEGLYKRALAIKEKALGADHPEVAASLNNLAGVYCKPRQVRRGRGALQARAGDLGEGARRRPPRCGEHPRQPGHALCRAAATTKTHSPIRAKRQLPSSLTQPPRRLARSTRRARAVSSSSARTTFSVTSPISTLPFRKGLSHAGGARPGGVRDGAMGEPFVRRRGGPADGPALCRRHRCACRAGARAPGPRRLLAQPRHRPGRSAFASRKASRTPPRSTHCASELAETESKLAANTARLQREFPDYAALASPTPLKAEDLQQLLGGDEALVFWLTRGAAWETYVFALTRDGFAWKTMPLGGEALGEKVAAFRRGLDVDALRRGLERAECTQAEADKRGLSRIECGRVAAKECDEANSRGLERAECAAAASARELFDLGLAHELYDDADRSGRGADPGQAASHRRALGRAHGAAVPSAGDGDTGGRRAAGECAARSCGLSRCALAAASRHAVSVLPSVASLKALRAFARKEQAREAADRVRRSRVRS